MRLCILRKFIITNNMILLLNFYKKIFENSRNSRKRSFVISVFAVIKVIDIKNTVTLIKFLRTFRIFR